MSKKARCKKKQARVMNRTAFLKHMQNGTLCTYIGAKPYKRIARFMKKRRLHRDIQFIEMLRRSR